MPNIAVLSNLSRGKLRAKIVRKGIFTQLSYNKPLDSELYSLTKRINRMFRTVLDYALYDVTSANYKTREEVYDWLDEDNKDFIFICELADLNPKQTYLMFMYFLNNFFKDVAKEFSCYKANKSDIVNTPSTKLV
jgi:hypothetical protein